MADYFSLTIECIDFVQDKVQGRHGTSLQLNECQCKYLADETLLKLKSHVLQVKGLQSNLNFVDDVQSKVLPHLHAAAMRAKILVECCCCENSSWVVAATKLASITEDVIAITLDIHQWTFLLDIAIVAIAGSCPETLIELLKTGEEDYQRLWRKLHSKDGNELQSAALEDQKNLLLKIAEVRKKHDLGEEVQTDDFIRAVYLEARVKRTEEDLQDVKELQDFTIIKDLGQGAAGMVLEASWLGHQCALKILNAIDKTESTVLNGLQHPNIVSLFHYWEVQTAFKSYIVMELMPTDLWRIIKLNRQQSSSPTQQAGKCMPFSLPVAIDIMLQVAEGMRYLHVNQKMTHRDLKTSNILVKPVSESTSMELHNQGYLEVKLADFGLAKAYLNSSISGILTPNAGTSVYGAPEIFGKEEVQRRTNFPPKADVWSFGMTCSEILTGEVPFTNEPRKDLHKRISKNGLRPVLPHDCPEYLQFCIRSCWELQPERRPSFSDICRLLRHAKFLSLGLMHFEINSCFFAYASRAGIFSTLRNPSTQASVISRLAQSVLEMVGFGGVHQKPIQPTIGESRDATEYDFDGLELTSSTKHDGLDFQFDAPSRTPDIPPLDDIPHVSHDFRLKSYFGICGGCGQWLGPYDRPLNCMDKIWHPDCFCCKFCNKPIADSECSVQGTEAYHHGCYKELGKERREETRIASKFDFDALKLAGTKPVGSHFQLDAPQRNLDKEQQGVTRIPSDFNYNDDLVPVKAMEEGSDLKFDSPPRTLGKEGQRPLGTTSEYNPGNQNLARIRQEGSHFQFDAPPRTPFRKERQRAPRFAPEFEFDGSELAGTGQDQGLEFNSDDLVPEKTMKEGIDFEFDSPPRTPTKEGQGPLDTTFEFNNNNLEPAGIRQEGSHHFDAPPRNPLSKERKRAPRFAQEFDHGGPALARTRHEGSDFQFDAPSRTSRRRVPQVRPDLRTRQVTHLKKICSVKYQVAPSTIGFVERPPTSILKAGFMFARGRKST